jgi:4-diphosphocytidyl-2-C-methyl-D-erythritol kinase
VGHTGGMPTQERALAFAKLTRTLRVVGRRDDGYHLLEAEMVTVDFADELIFSRAEVASLTVSDEIAWDRRCGGRAGALEVSGVPVDRSNLVLRALEIAECPARVLLRKRIPAGGGLGGGSADAAAALRYAGVLDPLVAVRLGADVPFCLTGGRAVVRGVGERVEPLTVIDLAFVVVTPAFGVATATAYAAYDELGSGGGPNDLERAALAVEPRLAAVRDVIAAVAGERPVLAGSGSSFFVECRPDAATALGSEIADATAAEGIVASVVGCSSTGSLRAEPPGD